MVIPVDLRSLSKIAEVPVNRYVSERPLLDTGQPTSLRRPGGEDAINSVARYLALRPLPEVVETVAVFDDAHP